MYTNAQTFSMLRDVHIFMILGMGTYTGVYGLHIHTWDACMSEN